MIDDDGVSERVDAVRRYLGVNPGANLPVCLPSLEAFAARGLQHNAPLSFDFIAYIRGLGRC